MHNYYIRLKIVKLNSITMHACMNRFVTSLKEKYINRQLGEEEQWPPVRGDRHRRLIKLQLVETDKEKRKSILHTDLFKTSSDNKPVRKIVVKGNAGIGKTTLCTMLAEEWAKGKILTQFDCVLLLPLRDNEVSSAQSLPELIKLFHPSEKVRRPPTERMEDKEGEGVLIIADGWDELSEGARANGSFLYKLLLGCGCSKASVLLTSRHSATAPLHKLPSVDSFIEVVGFDEENIKQYIDEDFKQDPEKASSLMEQLESNPLIQSLCSVPLNCAIVCDLWHKSQQTLPSTITELYFTITRGVVLRDINKKFPQYGVKSLESFDSIPEELKKEFWLVCRFAFEFLSSDQIVFSDSEIASFAQDTMFSEKKPFFFGLLQTAHSILPGQSSVGYGLSFHFAHLTIQEFLAALHIVTLSHEKKQKICDSYAGNDRFNMVWRFVFGLESKELKYSDCVVSLDDVLVDQVLIALRDHDILLCHCSLESQDKIVQYKVANRICPKFSYFLFSRPQTAHDCVALLHIFEGISHCSEVRLDFSESLSKKQLLKLATILINRNLQVKRLDLNNCKLTSKCLTTFFNKASASFRHLNSVSLDGNLITGLPFSPSINTLTRLSLSNNPLWQCGARLLVSAVCTGSLVKLEHLCLSSALTNNTDVIDATILPTLLPALATHCPHLNDLDLSENNLGVPSAGAVGEAFVRLATNKKELKLNLSDTNLNSEAVKALSDKVLSSLEDVSNPLSSQIFLHVDNNPLGNNGLLAIFKMLSNENCPVTSLYLDHTHAVNQGLITAISFGEIETLTFPGQCSKLTSLSFQNNKPSGDTHVACLTMAIKANIFGNLEWLHLSNTFPDTVEENGRLLTELLPSIASHCPHLNHHLDFSKNNLGVPGASAVGEAFVQLATNRKELILNLSETNLNSEAAKALSDKVLASLVNVSNPLSCKINLRVASNPLGHNGLLAIFKMLSNENCPVTKLDLEHTHAVNQGLITAISFGEIEMQTFPGQCSKLKRLSFQNNKPSGDTHVACLTMAIKANIFGNLEWLRLSNTLPDNVEENGRLLTELLPCIHCLSLSSSE